MATGITYTLLDFVFNCSPSPYIPLNRVALTQFLLRGMPYPHIPLCYNCCKLRPDAALSWVALLALWRSF